MAKTETAAPKARSFSEVAKEAGLPVIVSREFIAELGTVTWLTKEPGTARNPQTGEMDDVLMVDLVTDEGDNYRTVVGNVALTDVLNKVGLPMRAAIKKSGRTWIFTD
jgi:hypothetical protein